MNNHELFFDDLSSQEQQRIEKLVAFYLQAVQQQGSALHGSALTKEEYQEQYLQRLPPEHHLIFEYELAIVLSEYPNFRELAPSYVVAEEASLMWDITHAPTRSTEEVLQDVINDLAEGQKQRPQRRRMGQN